MSVYIDHLQPCPRRAGFTGWRWNQSCHLFADSLEELHAFARRIGLRRSWFQTSRGGLPHYDLNPGRRAVALRHGATELERAQAVAKWKEIKQAC